MKHIRTITIIALALSLASCSLKEDSSVVVNPYDFFNTEIQIRAALNGCYDPLHYIHNLKYYIALEGATDLASTDEIGRAHV